MMVLLNWRSELWSRPFDDLSGINMTFDFVALNMYLTFSALCWTRLKELGLWSCVSCRQHDIIFCHSRDPDWYAADFERVQVQPDLFLGKGFPWTYSPQWRSHHFPVCPCSPWSLVTAGCLLSPLISHLNTYYNRTVSSGGDPTKDHVAMSSVWHGRPYQMPRMSQCRSQRVVGPSLRIRLLPLLP